MDSKSVTMQVPEDLVPALSLIISEYYAAIDKHPKWPYDPVYAGAIVSEEAGELVRACLKYTLADGHKDEVQLEAVQTAATALRFLVNTL